MGAFSLCRNFLFRLLNLLSLNFEFYCARMFRGASRVSHCVSRAKVERIGVPRASAPVFNARKERLAPPSVAEGFRLEKGLLGQRYAEYRAE